MTKTMTVTQLRKEIFDVVEAAKINKQITDIMLHGEVVASLVPKKKEKFDWDAYKKRADKAAKYLAKFDWSDVLENRKKIWKLRKYKGW